MNYLITGHSGFVGQHLIRELKRNKNSKIYGLSRSKGKEEINEFFSIDVCKQKNKRISILKKIKPDVIFHLAGQSDPKISKENPELTIYTNVVGTMNILESVKEVNKEIRVILFGSAEEYEYQSKKNSIREHTNIMPANPYGISKATSYFLSRHFSKEEKLDIVYISPFIQIGPGQKTNSFVANVCAQIVEAENGGNKEIITGDISSERDFIDVCSGVGNSKEE